MSRVYRPFYDAGHGGSDPGARGPWNARGTLEKDITLGVVRYVGDVQREVGLVSFALGYSRISDVFVPLGERVQRAKDARADCFVSLHCNADRDADQPGMPEAEGKEIWCMEGSVEGLRLATSLAGVLKAEFPDEPWRGVKHANFAVLRGCEAAGIPAVLLEMAFIDHSASVLTLSDPKVQARLGTVAFLGAVGYLV